MFSFSGQVPLPLDHLQHIVNPEEIEVKAAVHIAIAILCIRLLHNSFLLKSIVFKVCEHKYMNMTYPQIIELATALVLEVKTFKVLRRASIPVRK